jgi:His-Xaa-Ser system protein HxsD
LNEGNAVSETDQSSWSEFDFDLAVYRLSAVKKAAYRFSGHFNIRLELLSDRHIRVTLSPRISPGFGGSDVNSFPNEVLDQDLRESIADETESVRDLLLAQTFSGLPLTDPIGEGADYHSDPLHITNPNHSEAAGE